MVGLAAQIAAALTQLDSVRAAWFFGSRARGTARADSDLDIAILYRRELDSDARERGRRAIVSALTDALGKPGEWTDVVDLDDCDPAVAFRAVTEGQLVIECDRRERVATVALIYRRYDDDAPRRELFRRAALRAVERMGDGRR